MSGHSYVQSVGRHSRGNMIANVMRDYILARRNSFVAVTYRGVRNGVVADDLLAQMLSVATSVAKQGACVSSHSSTRKLPIDRKLGWKNSNKRK